MNDVIANLIDEESLKNLIETIMNRNDLYYKESDTDEEKSYFRVDKGSNDPNGDYNNFKIELMVFYRNYNEYVVRNKRVMKELKEFFVNRCEWLDQYCRIYLELTL